MSDQHFRMQRRCTVQSGTFERSLGIEIRRNIVRMVTFQQNAEKMSRNITVNRKRQARLRETVSDGNYFLIYL